MAMREFGVKEIGPSLRPDKTAAPKFDLTVTEPLERWRKALLHEREANRRLAVAVSESDKRVATEVVNRARVERIRAKTAFEQAFVSSVTDGDV